MAAQKQKVTYAINADYKLPLVEAVRDILWGSAEPLSVAQVADRAGHLDIASYDLDGAVRVILSRMAKRGEAVKYGGRKG